MVEAFESRYLLSTFFIADPQFGGDDGNAGTDEQNPWATIGQLNAAIAAGQIGAGDTICFHRGDTFAGNLVFTGVGGDSGNPITLKDYGTDPNPPRIDAGDGTGILVQDAGNFEIANLEISGSYDPTNHPSSNGNGIEFLNTTTSTLDNIYIHDVTVHGFGNGGTTALVPDSGCGILIDAQSPPDMGIAYDTITISRCDISNTVRAGVEALDARYLDPQPFPASIAHVRIDHVDAHNIVPPVADGTIHAGHGIVLVGVDDAVVERCRVFNNGSRQIIDAGVGIYAYQSNHVLFQFNEVYGNQSQPGGDEGGFDFDRWTTNSIMQYNYSHDNDGYGYMLGSLQIPVLMSENNIVRFNVSQNDSRNSRYGALLFEDWAASDVYVYNNTFYMSDNGLRSVYGDDYIAPAIRFDADDPDNPPPPDVSPTIHIYNNLFLTDSPDVPVVYVEDSFPVSGLSFAGNDYFSNAQDMIQVRWRSDQIFNTLSDFQNATGQEQYNGMPVGASVSPRLNITEPAHTIGQIDQMASELMAYYQLAMDAPDVIKTGGVDLSMPDLIGPNWWAPDANWSAVLGTPTDFFGVDLPTQPGGPFCTGASQYPGP